MCCCSTQGKILDCIHRAPGGENAQRLLLPGKPYSPPPPQDKAPPLDDGSANYYERLAALVAGEGLLWKALTAQVAGVSPTQAREAAWLASGDANAPAHAASVVSVAQALQTLWLPVTTGQWQPGVIEETGAVVGFSVYPVHFRGEFIPCPTASEAVERYFAAPRAALPQADAYAAARGQVAAQLRQAQQRVTTTRRAGRGRTRPGSRSVCVPASGSGAGACCGSGQVCWKSTSTATAARFCRSP